MDVGIIVIIALVCLVVLCIKFAFDAGYYKGYADSCKETIEEVDKVKNKR